MHPDSRSRNNANSISTTNNANDVGDLPGTAICDSDCPATKATGGRAGGRFAAVADAEATAARRVAELQAAVADDEATAARPVAELQAEPIQNQYLL